MSWRPLIKNPASRYLHEAYGITEERRLELCARMDDMMRGPIRIVPSQHSIDRLADIAQTREEFTWLLVTHTLYMERRGGFL